MLQLSTKEDLGDLRKELLHNRRKINKTLVLCGGTGCRASRSQEVIDAVNIELLMQGMDSGVQLRITGCHGF